MPARFTVYGSALAAICWCACTPRIETDSGMVASFSDLADAGNWAFFDTTRLAPDARVFQGSAFDGRFLYLAPISGGVVTRYDTESPFTTGSSWSVFDIRPGIPGRASFVGAVFDGIFVYLVPFEHSVLARYDTRADFTNPSSWMTFDLSIVDSSARGFFGGAFDGRYVYLSPFRHAGQSHGLALRFERHSQLIASSFEKIDLRSIDTELVGFDGAAFDGRFVYFTPYAQGVGHKVARYDSTHPFSAPASWSAFDLHALDSRCRAFQGSIFDGRYLYLVPWDGGRGSVLARFDTTGDFRASAAWATFDLTQINERAVGFVGGQFDGRFIYLAPYGAGMSGLLLRFDTSLDLSDRAAWDSIDLTTMSSGARGYGGAGFDGRFIYLVPEETGLVARFDARSPPALPPLLGSFQ